MKKNNMMLGLGVGTAFLATCAIVKGYFDHKFGDEDLNEQEIPSIESVEDNEEDRGVSPLNSAEETEEQELEDEVPDLDADAINHAYQPIKY